MTEPRNASSGGGRTYFLSYARADQAFGLRLADDLIAAGVSVWVDQYHIRPSQHWDMTVESALRAADGLIVVLSPRSVASHNVADEVSVAIDGGKAVIPVMMEKCTLPLRMTRMQWIDATADYAAALRRCLAEMRGDAAPAAPPRPDQPRDGEGARAAAFPEEVLQRYVAALARYLGPIAPHVVAAERRRAGSLEDLRQRLGVRIARAEDRGAFFAATEAPGRGR